MGGAVIPAPTCPHPPTHPHAPTHQPTHPTHPTHPRPAAQLSKEVQKQREYEGALLRAYQHHLKALLGAADAASKGGAGGSELQSGRVAVRCMCLLLNSLPHFNYGADLLQVGGPAGGLACGHRARLAASNACALAGCAPGPCSRAAAQALHASRRSSRLAPCTHL
jgi:hypothetical protein